MENLNRSWRRRYGKGSAQSRLGQGLLVQGWAAKPCQSLLSSPSDQGQEPTGQSALSPLLARRNQFSLHSNINKLALSAVSPEILECLSSDSMPFSVQFSMLASLLWLKYAFLLNQMIACPLWVLPYDYSVRTKPDIKLALSAVRLLPATHSLLLGHVSVCSLISNESFQWLGQCSGFAILEKEKKTGL